MNKIFFILFFIFIMVGVTCILFQVDNQDSSKVKTESNNLYYGPVNIGYNETHFRLYGEHILEDIR